ncbi:MAG: hypothetical protein V4568_13580 [Pseudomonadota bacterium]
MQSRMDKRLFARVWTCTIFWGAGFANQAANAQVQDIAERKPGIALRLEKTLWPSFERATESVTQPNRVEEQVEVKAVEEGAPRSIKFAGYLKTLLINSKTPDLETDAYTLSLNRLRLKATYELPPSVQLHIEHDTEVRTGNYLKTAAFRREKDQPQQQYWRSESAIADERNYYVSQRLYRAYAKFSRDAADLTVGRQRIPLGTGRMWSTLDMLNPINPVQIEGDEYIGVDAGLLEYKTSALSKFSVIYAPDPASINDRWIGQYRINVEGTDVTLTQGKYWNDYVTGVDFATQVGSTGTGVHGELAYAIPEIGRTYQKLLLGFDHQFPNTFGLSAEIYYSSQRNEDRAVQFAQNPLRMQLEPLDGYYIGFVPSYEFTPLLKASSSFLFNLSDRSRFAYFSLSYSLSDNLNITGGMQFFSGSADSEYGQGKNLFYGQMQWFY